MKLFLLLLLLCTSIFATERVVTTKLAIGQSCYGTGIFECISITVWCINGYKWLQTGSGNSTSISQMFENSKSGIASLAIPCKN